MDYLSFDSNQNFVNLHKYHAFIELTIADLIEDTHTRDTTDVIISITCYWSDVATYEMQAYEPCIR